LQLINRVMAILAYIVFYSRPGVEITDKMFEVPVEGICKSRRWNFIEWKRDCLVIFVDIPALAVPILPDHITVKMGDEFVDWL